MTRGRMEPFTPVFVCSVIGCARAPAFRVYDGSAGQGEFCERHALQKVEAINLYDQQIRKHIKRASSREGGST